MKDLSVIVPVYNEEGNIELFFNRLRQVIDQLNIDVEFVFINDGSYDSSMNLIRMLAAKNPAIRFIDFSRNFGHQVAVTAGLDHCIGKAVVIIDADLQDPPELIIELHKRWQE